MTDTVALRPYARAWFFYFAAIGVYTLYAPLWFKEHGLSALAIGAIASVQSWTRVIAPYGWAWAADRSRHRVRLLRWAGVISALAALALALTGRFGFGAIVACVAVLFLANGAVMPLTEASLAHHLNLAAGGGGGRYGRTRVWGSVGFILSVSGFGFVLQRSGLVAWPWIVFGMWSLLAWELGRLPDDAEPPHREADVPAGAMAVLRRPEVAWFFGGVFLTVLAHTSLYTFFSLYMASFGTSESAIGLLWAVGVAVEIAFFWTQGHWFERLSLHGWLLLAAGLTALRFAAMAAFGDFMPVLVLAQTTHAITFAAQHTACIGLVARYFPGNLRGRGQALYSTLGYGASGVIGGVAGGALIERWGYTSVFWAASAAGVLAMLCLQRSRALTPTDRQGPN